MAIMRFISITRAFIRKLRRENSSYDVNFSGPKFKITPNLKGEALETRTGFDLNDKSSFYHTEFDSLYNIYYGYTDSDEYHRGILYAEVHGIKTDITESIRRTYFHAGELKLKVEPLSYKLPRSLKEHGKCAIEFFKTLGRIKRKQNGWENNESFRIVAISTENNNIIGQKASYFDQVATNLTLDWRSKKLPNRSLTIRNSIELPENGLLKTLHNSNLSNTLGVAVMLYNRALEPFIRLRSSDLAAIPQKGLHCSASGVFEMDDGIKAGEYNYTAIERGIEREIALEIGLDRAEYNLYPVAFARELPRGGKPQVFFIALTKLNGTEVLEKSRNADESWEFSTDNILKEKELAFQTIPEIDSLYEKFTYEGWACLQFCEDFLEVNKTKLLLDLNQAKHQHL
ncbi:hypothetical protein D3H41_10165 [Vibrio neocaledonicus]|nr:hypothetical protein [Vibrio alginolyticus]QCO86419.1 hypothetical protein D3H41_10165 [Vibrio neocaledonicus]